jgi:hypothetical protein
MLKKREVPAIDEGGSNGKNGAEADKIVHPGSDMHGVPERFIELGNTGYTNIE